MLFNIIRWGVPAFLLILALSMGGCAEYKPMSTQEIAARANAYTKCKSANQITMTTTDIKDVIIGRLLDKLPGSDPCAEILTSGDKAQVAIAQSNNELAGKGWDTLKIVGSIFMIEWGNVNTAKEVGKSAGHNTDIGRDSAGRDISYPTTTTETSIIGM